MSKATSFIGEHTVEFTIVPMLKNILEQEYEYVVPIFPWMTREGSSISRSIHKEDRFKIIGLYPRRPKLLATEEESIYIKISSQVVLGARGGQSLGIPIIGGLPLAKDLWELGSDPECLWFKLDFDDSELSTYKIERGKIYKIENLLAKKIFKSDSEILQLGKTAKTFNISEAMEAFRIIKMESMNLGYYSSFAYMGGYKPIYFLLK
jgi:hypothetical protein